MTWRNRITVTLALLGVLLGAGAVAAAPAQAGTGDCAWGRVCVWKVAGHIGAPAYYWTVPSGSGGVCFNYGAGLNDQVDSIAVKGGRSATQYRDANCSGNAVSFHYGITYGSPWYGSCGGFGWACVHDGGGGWLPSSVWVIKS